jgi:hypothetical protein
MSFVHASSSRDLLAALAVMVVSMLALVTGRWGMGNAPDAGAPPGDEPPGDDAAGGEAR